MEDFQALARAPKRRRPARRIASTALIAAGLIGSFALQARADALDDLLERLKERNVITEEEYKSLKDTREGERAVARERRKEVNEQQTKAEEVKKDGVQGWFRDGVVFESADKKTSIGITGRVQLDFRKFTGDDLVGTDTFDVRRAYLGVGGKFWDYYTFDVTADFAGLAGNTTTSVCTAAGLNANGDPACTATTNVVNNTGSHLDVAWLNAAWFKPAQFRFGQFKMPFSIEELTSSRFIDFQERSFVNALVPAKERGIMVHGEPVPGLFYGVAASTGEGKNLNESNAEVDKIDLIARVGANFAQFANTPNMVLHGALAYSTGTIRGNSSAPNFRTEARGNTIFSTTAFSSQATDEVDRTRMGAEAALAFGPVKLQAEYVKVDFDGDSTNAAGDTTKFDRALKAYYVSLNWLVTGEKWADAYRAGTFARVKPQKNFKPGGGGAGAWELGARLSRFDAGDFVGAGGFSGSADTDKATGLTLGVKWLPTPNTRFMLNFIRTKFDDELLIGGTGGAQTDTEKAVTLRAQFDF
jgi:phosphate-selective porin OprO and OprP